MTLVATSKTTRNAGPAVRINCPNCGPEVDAHTFEQVERMGVFFIPLLTQRETCVQCARCGGIQLSRLPLSDLGNLSATELDRWLYPRVSLVAQFIALASILLFCAPFVGLALGVIGLIVNFKSGGWPKAVSIVAIALALPITLFALVAVLIAPPSP